MASTPKRLRTHHLAQFKRDGRRFSMLTSYDALSARIFSEAGIEVLLVGDSLGNVVLGHGSTVPVTMDHMELFTDVVARAAHGPLVVADLPFGAYEADPRDAVRNAVRLMKAGAHAVKLEGGARLAPTVDAVVAAGIPVMGHLGFTPQSEHQLGGFRVQGRDTGAADRIREDAAALQDAGAFAVVLELVPSELAGRITEALQIPTICIGAGPACDGQVLVWQDMAGLSGFQGKFVRQYAQLGETLRNAAARYREDVVSGAFPDEGHAFD